MIFAYKSGTFVDVVHLGLLQGHMHEVQPSLHFYMRILAMPAWVGLSGLQVTWLYYRFASLSKQSISLLWNIYITYNLIHINVLIATVRSMSTSLHFSSSVNFAYIEGLLKASWWVVSKWWSSIEKVPWSRWLSSQRGHRMLIIKLIVFFKQPLTLTTYGFLHGTHPHCLAWFYEPILFYFPKLV